MAPIVGSKQAEQLKQDGNNYFKKNRIGAAIDAYTEAIALCPNVPIYWTNRALCHRRRNDWKRVEEDCRKAIQLDHNSVKALDLGRGAHPGKYIVEEIWEELAKAKYMEWEHESTRRSWDLQNLKESCESALMEKHKLDTAQTVGIKDEIKDENSASLLKQLEAVGEVFMKAAVDDIPTEVPDYLCCKITLDIFRDPVITPSGLTYERAVILEHLQKVGKFDPITREPLLPSQLVPNLAIKESVRAFLDRHGWAYRIQ